MVAVKNQMTKHLYLWVLIGIATGALIGFFAPDVGVQLKVLGDTFISLIKMLIAPLIFCTVVLGISGAGDMKKVGRVGLKTLLYFEVLSTIALALGLLIANVLKPGKGFNVNPLTLDATAVSQYTQKANVAGGYGNSLVGIVAHIVPKTFVEAFTGSGDLLQVLLLAVLFGYAMNKIGESGKTVHDLIEKLSAVLFAMMKTVMMLAPLGAGGAMAFTIGKYGLHALAPLASLMGCFYLTCVIFVFAFLGLVGVYCRFNIFKFLFYIKEEILLVLGTSSSESALVPLMQKMEKAGCSKSIVGLVIPSGYSFNLDGTNIYLTMAALFITQALNIDLSLKQQLSILLVAVLTSKGASGVTGAGFITLAATLTVVPEVPVAGLALILGVDRFMSEARAITNMIGNGVATVLISKWEKDLDHKKLNEVLK